MPVVNGLAQEYQGRLQVVRLDFNAERNQAVLAALNARLHPALYFLDRGGAVRVTRFGPHTAEELRPLIDQLFAGGGSP